MGRVALNTLFVTLAASLALLGGLWAGNVPRRGDYFLLSQLACLTGVTFLLADVTLILRARVQDKYSPALVIGIAVYAAFLLLTEPFLLVYRGWDLIRSVFLLGPLIVGGVVLPRQGRWLAAVGTWLLLFASVAALSYNVRHVHQGVGFFQAWAD